MSNLDKRRRELLEKLLTKELNRMRLMLFKRKRRPLLYGEVSIDVISDEYTESNPTAAGYYTCEIDNNGKYHHHIFVRKQDIDWQLNNTKQFRMYNELCKIIRHELCHAFVHEYFGKYSKVDRIEADCSFVFLLFMRYFGCGDNDHEAYQKFEKKYGWKLLMGVDNFDQEKMLEVAKIFIDSYNATTEDLSHQVVNNTHYYSNSFEFGNGNTCGLEAVHTATTKSSIPEYKTATVNKFLIGSCIMSEDLPKYVKRKILNGNFKHNYTKQVNKDKVADRLYLQTRVI